MLKDEEIDKTYSYCVEWDYATNKKSFERFGNIKQTIKFIINNLYFNNKIKFAYKISAVDQNDIYIELPKIIVTEEIKNKKKLNNLYARTNK